MKQHSMLGRRFGTATFVIALITACANGDTNETDDAATTNDASMKKDTGNPQPDTGSGNMCTTCNIDLDCQNTCGAPPNGMTWCCDTGMNSCYPAQACQDQDAGGTD